MGHLNGFFVFPNSIPNASRIGWSAQDHSAGKLSVVWGCVLSQPHRRAGPICYDVRFVENKGGEQRASLTAPRGSRRHCAGYTGGDDEL
jgi:hypothetical protein